MKNKQLLPIVISVLASAGAAALPVPMTDATATSAATLTSRMEASGPMLTVRIDNRHLFQVEAWFLAGHADGLWWQYVADDGWVPWRSDQDGLQSLGVTMPGVVARKMAPKGLPGRYGDVHLHAAYQLVDGTLIFNTEPVTVPRSGPRASPFHQDVHNESAYIPPQCYTDTIAGNRVFNPCFTCHTESRAPNVLNDDDLQLEYILPDPARVNRWSNLFRDRSQQMAAISEDEILQWVRQDNHADLAGRLRQAMPEGWDSDGDGLWGGYLPDAHFNFDDQGFDRAADGTPSGWRAYGYYPFPGTFWPTNGSAGDVMIRLAEPLRTNEAGVFDLDVYRVNLAIVEAAVKERTVPLLPGVDERPLGQDLDGDGVLGMAERLAWPGGDGQDTPLPRFVGAAGRVQQAGGLHLAAGLFPEGTEFLHSLRYLDVDEGGEVQMASRMKELRHARKDEWVSPAFLAARTYDEIIDKLRYPERLRRISGSHETGLDNGQGWRYQGFIEDETGALRPQTREEQMFCMGCHAGVGATRDGIFSFSRKLEGAGPAGGWFHWTQRSLRGIPEPLRADGQPEYAHYLWHNGAGDEFRANDEVMERFFDGDGHLDVHMLAQLRQDVSVLLLPSRERALDLNRAYRLIVAEQSYVLGRDAILKPVRNVLPWVREGQTTGIREPLRGATTVYDHDL